MMREQVREFFENRLKSVGFNDSDDVFTLGFVSSMFALQLVTFVENEFGVVVEDDDLELSNFNSVNAICDFVERKKKI